MIAPLVLASPAKTSGLSVTALASRTSTSAAWRSWSRQAPTTCGWQRRLYGSWTRSSPCRCERRISLPASRRAVVARDVDLPRLAAQLVDARIERAVAAARRVDRERADDERRFEHRLEREQRVQGERGRDLRAVDEREPFLRCQRERREAGAAQHVGRRTALAVDDELAFADQGERQMGERREVARGADRSLRRNERNEAGVVNREERIDHRLANARVAARETRRLEPRISRTTGAASARRRRRCASGSG